MSALRTDIHTGHGEREASVRGVHRVFGGSVDEVGGESSRKQAAQGVDSHTNPTR